MTKKPKKTQPLPSVLTVASAGPAKSTPPRPKSTAAPAKGSTPANAKSRPTAKPKASARSRTAAAKSAAPAKLDAPAPSTPTIAETRDSVEVTFRLLQPEAHEVLLGGTFNGWSAETTPLQRLDQGRWEARLTLPPGRHEYKFCVDGHWLPDPNAQQQSTNSFGTVNSVVDVRI